MHTHEIGRRRGRIGWVLVSMLVACAVVLAGCAHGAAREPPVAARRPLEALIRAARFPDAEPMVVLGAMQLFSATHREWEGYALFGALAREQPDRAVFFHSLEAVMQVRVAGDVPLLERIAWVNDAIAKLDRGVAAAPLQGRFARGLVFAELPARFGKARAGIEDLEACLEARTRLSLPFGADRGIYRALASAYRTLGDDARSHEMLARAGVTTSDGAAPHVLENLSVDATHGFRFREKRLVREADGVYVAEGYDFANIVFIVGKAFVVAIDAGTTVPSAREAVAALRTVTPLPIKYVVLTHGHWDHVGGLAALREPGTVVVASAAFPEVLARSRRNHAPFQYFFGSGEMGLDVRPDRLIRAPETLSDGDVELSLIPAKSGETEDALFVRDAKHDILFVGDAFMPYAGAPFVAEGSTEGFLGAIEQVLELAPRRLVHGHPPLTTNYTIEAMPGLRDAIRALLARTVEAAQAGRPIADVLHDDFLPDSLRSAPKAVLPYLVARDTLVQRTYAEHAGYWQANGDGMDHFTRDEWSRALDILVGGSDDAFARASAELERRGDAELALRIAEAGLLRHPASEPLQRARDKALVTLREIYAQMNPFRFIIYSEWAHATLPPVEVAPAPRPEPGR